MDPVSAALPQKSSKNLRCNSAPGQRSADFGAKHASTSTPVTGLEASASMVGEAVNTDHQRQRCGQRGHADGVWLHRLQASIVQ